MSFSQIFPLDVISEASRETNTNTSIISTMTSHTNMSLVTDTEGVDTSYCSDREEGMNHRQYHHHHDHVDASENMNNMSSLLGTRNAPEEDYDDDDDDQEEGEMMEDNNYLDPVFTSSSYMTDNEKEIFVDEDDEVPQVDDNDITIQEDDDDEEEGKEDDDDDDIEQGYPTTPTITNNMDSNMSCTSQASTVVIASREVCTCSLDILPPPSTPTTTKKTSSGFSPTGTVPLSPENSNDEMEYNISSSSLSFRRRKSMICGFSRPIVLGTIIVLLLAALIGIVVSVTNDGDGKDSSNASAASNKSPDSPVVSTTVATPIATTTVVNPTPSSLDTTTVGATVSTTTTSTTTTTPATSTTAATTTTTTTTTTTNALDAMPFLVDLTPTTILQDPTTIQGQALIWLAESIQHPQGFPMSLETDREYIRQRYAATVLDRATQEDGIPRVSVSGSDTCDWTGIQCVNGTITTINWANSDLVGYLPEEVAGFTDLITLDLGENQLTGPLPDGLFNCSKLEYLYLHENNLNGSLSERFADLPALIRIYLGNNQFTGNLPQGFGSPDPNSGNNVRPLRYLSVHNNDLTGPIPQGWNLRFLFFLDLSYNRLTGNLPTDWADAPSGMNRIKLVMVDHNQLSGQVPANYPNMGNGRIELLHLSDNQLTGVMPGEFDPVTFISSLEFQNNQFTAMDTSICNSLVFGSLFGEITNFHADCDICACEYFCEPGVCFN